MRSGSPKVSHSSPCSFSTARRSMSRGARAGPRLMGTCAPVGCAVRRRQELWPYAAETGHALPVVFVLNSAMHADLVGPVILGIGDRESELVVTSKEQPYERGQHDELRAKVARHTPAHCRVQNSRQQTLGLNAVRIPKSVARGVRIWILVCPRGVKIVSRGWGRSVFFGFTILSSQAAQPIAADPPGAVPHRAALAPR